MSMICMLSTLDNPYNPFEQFDDWFRFDNDKGYNSCGRLARILDKVAPYRDDMSDNEIEEATEIAIDEIIKYDFMNIYKKVTKTTDNTVT